MLIIFSVLVPTLVNAITVDPNLTTFDLATETFEDSQIDMIIWIVKLIVFLSLGCLIISSILMMKNNKKANQLIAGHHIEPKPESKILVEREKIELKYNYLIWFKPIGCFFILFFIPAFIDITVLIIYSILFFTYLISYIIIRKKYHHELSEFDNAHPEVKNILKNIKGKKIQINSEFSIEYNKYMKLKKRYSNLLASSIMILFLTLIAWAVIIFVTTSACCVTY